ncbi:MAG TPA: ABC transporter ATP-binding protein [Nitriliruptorales bacterium]
MSTHLTPPQPQPASGPLERPHPLRRLWAYARRHRGAFATSGLYTVLNQVFDIMPPLLIGAAVDIVVSEEDSWFGRLGITDLHDQLYWLAALTVLVWVLESVFEYLEQIGWRNLAQTIQHELRGDAYGHVQTLDQRFFEDESTGGLMAVLNDDVNQLERFLDIGAGDILRTLTSVIGIGIAFFVIAPEVAWLSFLPLPLVLAGSIWFQHRIAPRYVDVREQVGLLNHQLANNLSGIQTIKSFTAEEREVERMSGLSDDYRLRNRKAIALSSAFVPVIRMAILAGFIATLVYGGIRVLDGALAIGLYSVMVFLTQRLLWPITRLGETIDLYQRAMASTNRVLDLLGIQPQIRHGHVRLAVAEVSGAVRFDGVTFGYLPGHPVLRDLDLRFPAGETSAIVGATGAGKSTIVKLLLRFYDPDEGAVTLEGHDLRDLDVHDLRRSVGLVSQDVFLFHGTVFENIAYGRPGASHDEVVAAARAAEAHEFVQGLPDGYDTIVGERGQKLSGGQRQRVSIARAVLKDPPILVFDEATSSVDNETEAAIQRSLEALSVGRTTIVIAHRLSTVRHADRIYVLSGGTVEEVGHHDDLVAHGGTYASLWAVQTGAVARAR